MKIYDSFIIWIFLIFGFNTSFWSHSDANVGGIMLYVTEDIPANLGPLQWSEFKKY